MLRTMICLTIILLAASLVIAAEPAKAKSAEVNRGVEVTRKVNDTRSRIALVIGNGSYVASSPLKNPVKDAVAMAATLRRLGFEVEEKTDLGDDQMNKAVESFGKKLKPGGVGLFYYAGHGIQVNGANYLIPVDAVIEDENEVRYKAVDAGLVLAKMEQAKGDVNIVILDACRNNPFPRSFRSATQGLASMDAPSGSLIAYATAPGKTARDGKGENGVYTEELIKMMESPGLTVEEALKRVRKAVMTRTASAQVPWEASSLTGDFHFIPPSAQPDLQPALPQPAAQPSPAGNAPPQQATLRGFTDPTTGMEFVPVTGGCYTREHEFKKYEVCVSDFVIGRYEVTQEQWQKIMDSNPSKYKDCGANCPVDSVSWSDVQEFIQKLNRQTSRNYRLPTEAEWEYACRSGGKNEKYCGGDNPDDLGWSRNNSKPWFDLWSDPGPHPIGQKKPNGLGIYDMHGNINEWVQDKWQGDYYEVSPRENPQGPNDYVFVPSRAFDKWHVTRGGSFNGEDTENDLIRGVGDITDRYRNLGFRLAAPVR